MKSKYTKEDVIRAFEEIVNDMLERKASLAYKVPRSTLQSRIEGHESRQ
jgi:hypothetical protein